MNGSGFFVFNEDDLKSMTDMSPKEKCSRKNVKEFIKVDDQCAVG